MNIDKNGEPKKMSAELDDMKLDASSWVMQNVIVTVEAEGDVPELRFDGILFVSKTPINQN